MKINLLPAAVLTTIGLSAMGPIVQAATYPSELQGISDVNASVILGEDGGPSIPPIDPEIPPIDPENPNPNVGPLSIRYISDFNFGDVEVSTEGATVLAQQDVDANGVNFDHMVTVQDFRSDMDRDGWELTVTMANGFIPGSQIKLTPFIHATNADRAGVETPSSELVLNNSAQVFARTTSNQNPADIVSMLMANPDSDGIELFVPGNTPTGDYSTTVTWNLISGPMMPEPEVPEED